MKKLANGVIATALAAWIGHAQAVPISAADQVAVDGTIWAQADLFTGLNWNDINAVCPGGSCTAGESLNGYDMTGWQWASVDDVDTLFNSYLVGAGITGTDLLSGPDAFVEADSAWGPAFTAAGQFRPTYTSNSITLTSGFLVTQAPDAGFAYVGQIDNRFLAQRPLDDTASTNTSLAFDSNNDFRTGGWFYQASDTEVPAPATLLLLLAGLAGVGASRFRAAKQIQ